MLQRTSRAELLERIGALEKEEGSLSSRLSTVEEELTGARRDLEALREAKLTAVLDEELPPRGLYYVLNRSRKGPPGERSPVESVTVGARTGNEAALEDLEAYVPDTSRASVIGLLSYFGRSLSDVEPS